MQTSFGIQSSHSAGEPAAIRSTAIITQNNQRGRLLRVSSQSCKFLPIQSGVALDLLAISVSIWLCDLFNLHVVFVHYSLAFSHTGGASLVAGYPNVLLASYVVSRRGRAVTESPTKSTEAPQRIKSRKRSQVRMQLKAFHESLKASGATH